MMSEGFEASLIFGGLDKTLCSVMTLTPVLAPVLSQVLEVKFYSDCLGQNPFDLTN